MSDNAGWTSIEDLEMFRKMERLCDEVWRASIAWTIFGRDTIGKQLVRAADSVCANLVEGDGRFHHKDKLNHMYIARGSIRETAYWIRRAGSRHMLSAEQQAMWLEALECVRRWINSLISQRRQWAGEVHESSTDYGVNSD